MNSAPHLLREDRPEFERVLDEALRSAHHRPDLAALGQRLNAEQLRTMALSAATAISACAEAEYQQFVRLREELRQPANAPSSMGPAPEGERGAEGGAGRGEGGVSRLATAMGGESLAEAGGAGLIAIVSVLAPVLAGTAAVIFLLLGYVLHLMTPEPSIAQPMRSVGWVFAALAAAGILVAMCGLLLSALRNGSSSVRASKGKGGRGTDDPGGSGGGGLSEEVALARAAWREALLERGIVPFLREALADPQGADQAPATYVQRERRSALGYTHPDFSSRPSSESPDEPGTRPRFTSPDYSSPDYGGPEH